MFLLPRPPEGELFSNQIWALGPGGSASLHAAATNLMSVAQQVRAVLAGHQANSGVLQAVWQGPTGELANAADTPHQAWLVSTATQLEGAAAATQGLGTAFDTAQMATPHPAAFAANNAEYPVVVGLMLTSLGIIWQPYVQNGMEYLAMTAMADAAQGAYTSGSGTILGTMPPLALTPPPASGTPGAVAPTAPFASGANGSLMAAAAGLGASPASAAAMPAAGAAMQPLSAANSLMSQPTNALASSGQLASTAGPMAASPASGLGGMPSSAMSPVGSHGNGQGGPGTNDGTWYGTGAGTGGTVAAALSGGGGGAGMGGLGGAGAAMAPLRGPVSWASTATAAPAAEQPVVSQFAQTRAAMAGSPTSASMGSPGTMMPPAARQGQESESARDRALDSALATAAALYRPPRDMPVVTGAAGMHYLAGEEDQ